MKRIWIGIGLLVALLVSGLWISEFMEDAHMPTCRDLQEASVLAMDDEWGKAEALAKRAADRWQKKRHVTAAFADHEPMDEIDALFAELKIYAAAGDEEEYSSACAHLASLLKAMGECHGCNWWNLM